MINIHLKKTRMVGFIRRWADYCFRRNIKLALPIVFLFGIFKEPYRHNKLLPIEWLDENRTHLIRTLDQQKYDYSYGPHVLGGLQRVKQVQLPAVNLYYFEDARVSVLSSSIVLNNKIIIERVENVDVKKCDYSSGHVFMHDQENALVRNMQVVHLNKGIFLGGNGSSNYYHWMIEILPKLKYIYELDKLGYRDFPLLVSEDVDHITTFRESLNYICKDRPVLKLDRDKAYNVGKLAYINAPNNLPFNLKRNEKMRISDFLLRISSIDFLRDRLRRNADATPLTNSIKRIFFARHDIRRNYNQSEIFEIFKLQGFQKVFMEDLSLREQISLIANAEMIAGPTGAAWTNLIFCRKGTKCLCWIAEGYGEFSAFSNLAKIVGINMYYVTFKTNAKSIGELYSADYFIDPQRMKQELEKFLKAEQ